MYNNTGLLGVRRLRYKDVPHLVLHPELQTGVAVI